MIAEKTKGYREAFARFFEAPTREGLRKVLQEHAGETDNLDFKQTWPKHPSLARHVLALGNSLGGCIVIGVAEKATKELEATGVGTVVDKADIMSGLKKFLPTQLLAAVDVLDFTYADAEYPAIKGKTFQVLLVDPDESHGPFLALRSGEGLKENAIYVRRGTSSIEANHDELQRLISRRVESGHSSLPEITLKQHIDQLKVLEAEAPSQNPLRWAFPSFDQIQRLTGPREDTADFLNRMVRVKKGVIERIVRTGT